MIRMPWTIIREQRKEIDNLSALLLAEGLESNEKTKTIEGLVGFLRDVTVADRTPEYEYGEKNSAGLTPPACNVENPDVRWLNPLQLAHRAIYYFGLVDIYNKIAATMPLDEFANNRVVRLPSKSGEVRE